MMKSNTVDKGAGVGMGCKGAGPVLRGHTASVAGRGGRWVEQAGSPWGSRLGEREGGEGGMERGREGGREGREGRE